MLKDIKYNLGDVAIVPAKISNIESRKECNIYYDNKLPIFAAPMDSVVNLENIDVWTNYGITPIIPRNIDIANRLASISIKDSWIAVSLEEFEKYFTNSDNWTPPTKQIKVLIDIANGHMHKICDLTNIAKEWATKNNIGLKIMIGNIANPETYKFYCIHSNVDYIRVGIGGGTVCTTSSQTGIHYPMASLINECHEIKMDLTLRNGGFYPKTEYKCTPKIIADGGIRTYADAIKALALGADYVMIGSTFASLYESASTFFSTKNIDSTTNISYKILGFVHDLNDSQLKYSTNNNDINLKKTILRGIGQVYKRTYGMSTPEAQKNINSKADIKITEGTSKWFDCTKTVYDWVNEFSAYLKSAMSYTDCKDITEFIGEPDVIIMSNNTCNSINSSIDKNISFDY